MLFGVRWLDHIILPYQKEEKEENDPKEEKENIDDNNRPDRKIIISFRITRTWDQYFDDLQESFQHLPIDKVFFFFLGSS